MLNVDQLIIGDDLWGSDLKSQAKFNEQIFLLQKR